MSYRTYLRGVWIAVWCFWITILILAPAIAIQILVSALKRGQPVPWREVAGAIAMMPAGTTIVWLMRRWFNFVAGTEIAKWRLDR
jgi:hypothetical protein